MFLRRLRLATATTIFFGFQEGYTHGFQKWTDISQRESPKNLIDASMLDPFMPLLA